MNTTYPLVLTQQYNLQAKEWLKVINMDESLAIIFFPKTDRLRRIEQLIDDDKSRNKYLKNHKKYYFQFVDFSTINIEDRFDMQEYLNKQLILNRIAPPKSSFDETISFLKKQDISVLLVLYEAEKYLNTVNCHILDLLGHLVSRHSHQLNLISLFEADITHSKIMSFLPKSTTTYDNMFYYPLYSYKEALIFVKYLEAKWEINIPEKTEKEIAKMCGGHFWLIKEAVREINKQKHWYKNREGIQFRLNSIYEALSESEKKLLNKLETNTPKLDEFEKKSLSHMIKLNLINHENECLIPLLEEYIKEKSNMSAYLEIDNNLVILNKVPINNFFSHKEQKALKYLLKHKNEVVTREDLGNSIWNNNPDQYSDWALDQIIARLRKRLKKISISPKIIQSIRNKGYKINLKYKYE